MRILLISPSSEEFVNHSKAKKTICMALPLLATYTPKNHEVIIADHNYGDDVYLDNIDLVGISAMTSQAYSAYKIAKYYRDKGVKVVMGGIHASMLPNEALSHVDSVCIGEGDSLWSKIISDVEKNKLKKEYKANELFPMEKIPPLNQKFLSKKELHLVTLLFKLLEAALIAVSFVLLQLFLEINIELDQLKML